MFTNKVTRFDLEDEIMNCWHIVDDLDTLLSVFDKTYTEDELMNIIIGLRTLYEHKFQKLFDTFSKTIEQ
jgi:hypothetical protein